MAARLAGPRIRGWRRGAGHPGADDPLCVVPEARQKAERTPSFSGLLAPGRYPVGSCEQGP